MFILLFPERRAPNRDKYLSDWKKISQDNIYRVNSQNVRINRDKNPLYFKVCDSLEIKHRLKQRV